MKLKDKFEGFYNMHQTIAIRKIHDCSWFKIESTDSFSYIGKLIIFIKAIGSCLFWS